jgi:RimJ/RimL family protein N-acetyltransferase
LETPDFILRAWRESDLEHLVLHANNERIAIWMMDRFPHPYTVEKGRWFIDFVSKGEGNHIYAIEINGKACGSIGLHFQTDIHKRNAEIGYWLGEEYWGQGIITEAIRRITKIGFDNFPINRIYGVCFGNNLASQRVLQKAGFVMEAHLKATIEKNGRIEDELIFAIRRPV